MIEFWLRLSSAVCFVVPSAFYRFTASCFLLFACLWFASLSKAEDWPAFQHDNHRSASTSESLAVAQLSPQWVYQSPQPPQPAWDAPARWDAYAGIRGLKSMRNYDPAFHAVVAGQSLCFGSTVDDAVHCLDTSTGKERWLFMTDGAVRIAPSYSNGRLYFGSDDGHAYCVDASNGRLIWKFTPSPKERLILNDGRFIPFWPCRTGVLVDGGTAYFAMGLLPWKESYLCAVDALTGKPEGPGRFVRKLNSVTFEGALLASSQRLISPQGRVAPLLFNRKDGAPLGGLEGGGGCFVLLTEDARVLHGPGNKTGWIQESNEKDRSKIANFNGGNALVVRGHTAYVLSDYDLMALDRSSRKELWRQTSDCPNTLILAGDVLFAGGVDKVAAFSAGNGQRLWQSAVAGRAYGLAVANGALFVSTDEGAIHAFRALDAKLEKTLGQNQAPTLATETAIPLRTVTRIDDPALLDRWVFQEPFVQGQTVKNLAGRLDAKIVGNAALERLADVQALELDGGSQSVTITSNLTAAGLPKDTLTAEAWVRVDQPLQWGGIIGALQDNGDFERGWLLGYMNSKFSFALAAEQGPRKLTFLSAKSDFEPGQWHHVLGAYDGREMRLYVNGRLESTATNQHGPILYPPKAFYEVGAYHDDDEYYRLRGMVREVRVYRRALSNAEALEHAGQNLIATPPKLQLAAGPWLKFDGQDRAAVWWRTAQPVPSVIEWGLPGEPPQSSEDATSKTEHTATLTGLRRNRVYQYTITGSLEGRLAVSDKFECDTHFNYVVPAVPDQPAPYPADHLSSLYAEAARELLTESGVNQGICLVLGCGEGRLAYELAKRSRLRIVGVDTDARLVEAARRALQPTGIYGARISFHHVESLSALPFTGWFANLMVFDRALTAAEFPVPAAGVVKYLRPYGGVALLGRPSGVRGGPEPDRLESWLKGADATAGVTTQIRGTWAKIVRGALPGAGEWSHEYGTAANAAYAGESLQGASSTADLEVQWLGRPGPRAQADRNGRKPSPLSVNGRLFVQGLHRIIALDAFNGTVLWSREIPPLERFNMPRDSSNWCADHDSVYAAIGDQCWRLDAATGKVSQFYPLTSGARAEWQYDWSYLSVQGNKLIGSAVKKGAAFTEFWGGADAGWYDATNGPATHKVCSENLFALNRESGQSLWRHAGGMVLNSTISIGGNRLFFLESRHPKVKASESHRLGFPELWQDLHLVALDLDHGYKVWEQRITPAAGTVMASLAYGQDKLALVTSGDKNYHVYAFDAAAGKPTWHSDFAWLKDNHGGHMARPAIIGNHLLVRPKVFDLLTGRVLPQTVPGGGCGTYAATDKALFFRDSNVTVWGLEGGNATSWERLRPDCWLSTVPANGLLLSPEAGGGCSCGSWMETSIAFGPKISIRP